MDERVVHSKLDRGKVGIVQILAEPDHYEVHQMHDDLVLIRIQFGEPTRFTHEGRLRVEIKADIIIDQPPEWTRTFQVKDTIRDGKVAVGIFDTDTERMIAYEIVADSPFRGDIILTGSTATAIHRGSGEAHAEARFLT